MQERRTSLFGDKQHVQKLSGCLFFLVLHSRHYSANAQNAASRGSGALTGEAEVRGEHRPTIQSTVPPARPRGFGGFGEAGGADVPLPCQPPVPQPTLPSRAVWSRGVTAHDCRIYLTLNCWVFLILKFHRSVDSAPHLWLEIGARK